jgi:hypothetical protein
VDVWGGIRDRDGRPWLEDTMAPSYSTSKGVAATLVHILVDRGLLDYEDRVAKHWPEFAQNGKARITLRQVLAHQSGSTIRQMIDHADACSTGVHGHAIGARGRSTRRVRTGYAYLRLPGGRAPAAGDGHPFADLVHESW